MTLEQLISLYRAQSMDDKFAVDGDDKDVFCSDELLTLYANEAQDEACRRGELLRDSASAMCVVTFAADAQAVALDPRIVRVISARVDGHPAALVSGAEMDMFYPNWQDDGARNRPTHLVSGMTTGMLHLWPIPAAPGTIRLTVQRLPLKQLANDTDKPEIRPELHRGLVEWMLFRAYSRQDTDLYNDAKAAIALGRFEAEFGRKTSGRNEEWVRRGSDPMPGPIA